MRGDFSRLTFDALKHYTGVLHQQGRVWLDADWNEDVLHRLYLLQQATADIIGACGAPINGVCDAPEAPVSFRISPNPALDHEPDDFLIAGGPGRQGHYYVDGILCQLDAPASYLKQPDFPAPPRLPMPAIGETLDAVVYLEVWWRLITYLEDETLREVALGGPDTAVRLKTVTQVKVQQLPAVLSPPAILSPPDAGDFTCLDAAQHLPPQGGGRLTTLQTDEPSPPDLCRILDPQTYTGRENHLYRVEIYDGGDVLGAAAGGAFRLELDEDTGMGALSVKLAAPLSTAQAEAALRAGVVTLRDDQGQMETVPLADVAGATLSLGRGLSASYTTANRTTVTGGTARFKWSRDNAAFAVRVTAVAADRRTLTLASLGRDQATVLREGDLVEVVDDASELGPARGHLTSLTAEPDPDAFTVTLAEALPPSLQVDLLDERHMLLRRWDGTGLASATFGATTTPEMNLGDGVHIQFGGERPLPGDFWMFTARSADGSVELLTDAPPMGIVRHRCPLALVRWSWVTDNGAPRLSFEVRSDCRSFFPALTDLMGLFYVSGDGQEATPDLTQPAAFVPLAVPLCVGVANGRCPVAGERVRFQIEQGSGRLNNVPLLSPPQPVDVFTDATGIACVRWELDSTTVTQRVTARLLDADGNPLHLPVHFTANLSVAAEVAYDPANCAHLAGVKTVQEAIDRLCALERGGCEVTVGVGGQFGKLEEAIAALRAADATTWCLCLLPGEHPLPGGLRLEGNIHVSISACSPGVRLLLDQPLLAGGLASFKLTGMTVEAGRTPLALQLEGCRTVSITDVIMNAEEAEGEAVVRCLKCGVLTMQGDTITASRRQSLLHCEGTERVSLHECRLVGRVDVPSGTVVGQARWITLEHNELIAPSTQKEMPRLVFTDFPELIAMFELPDTELFIQQASEIAGRLARSPAADRRAMATNIQARANRRGTRTRLAEHERNRLSTLGDAIVLGDVERIRRGLQNLRNLEPALILLDGDANTTLHANLITGLVSMYGPPGPSRLEMSEQFFKGLGDRIGQGEFQLTVVDGVFQGWGNRLTRFVLGEAVVRRILELERSGAERLYQSVLCTDNVIELGENYFFTERLSLASTFFHAGDERPGVSIGRAATFVGNHGPQNERMVFVNVCRTHEQAANLMRIDHV